MRMWMINPKILCRKHLLGEHIETHMFLGTLKSRKQINGYIEKNLFEPASLYQRHEELKNEMLIRNYNHKSEMVEKEVKHHIEKLNKKYIDHKVNWFLSLIDLVNRCEECKHNLKEFKNNAGC
jgi:hypothetical protein